MLLVTLPGVVSQVRKELINFLYIFNGHFTVTLMEKLAIKTTLPKIFDAHYQQINQKKNLI